MIDVSAVQAFDSDEDVRELAEIAVRRGFIMAHALPHFVPLLRSLIPRGGQTKVGGPVGFPSGGHSTATKIVEAQELVRFGAEEVDLMMNIGRLKSGDVGYVQHEIAAVVEAVQPIPVKVIIEEGRLSDDRGPQSLRCCRPRRSGVRENGHGLDLEAGDDRTSRADRPDGAGRGPDQSVWGHQGLGHSFSNGGARGHTLRH